MIFKPAILYIDDEPANLDTFKRAFGSDFLVKTCLSAEEALKILEEEDFPLIISDQRMPGMSGIELCEKLVLLKPESIRMILTAYTETQMLLDAIHKGHVHDYIVKPWRKSDLKPVLEKAFQIYKDRIFKLRELENRAETAERILEEQIPCSGFSEIVGSGGGLQTICAMLGRVAPTDSTVLLLGETGTGKEVLARAIHQASPRAQKPFVPLHCAALAQSVLESELFGHEKGAFTGADQVRVGRFELANGGTLFLDELGEIPENIQVKLLRVLQERVFERVGGNKSIATDVRVIGATHRNLEGLVQQGRFRQDLYYRLNVVPIQIPSLRDRTQDIEPLALYFLKKLNQQMGRDLSLSPSALNELKRYDWPGNVRELQNVLERAVILTPGSQIDSQDLNLNLEEMLGVETVSPSSAGGSSSVSVRSQIFEEEVRNLTETLRKSQGNISQAARALGVARSTLFHRLKKYGLL